MNNNRRDWNEDTNYARREESMQSAPNTNAGEALSKIMDISSAHFKSQAFHTFVKLKIPDLFKDHEALTISDIAHQLKVVNKQASNCVINEDALYRTMRLMTTLDVVVESYDTSSITSVNNDSVFSELSNIKFHLTSFGKLLQQNNSTNNARSERNNLSSCILHWMEKPLNDAWYFLPEYILGSSEDPFEQANDVSSDYFYNAQDNPQSLDYANDLVRLISDSEITSIVNCFDWSTLEGKTIIDIGGYNGKVLGAVGAHYSNTDLILKSLDLPNIISSIAKVTVPNGVQLIEGNVMDISTLPKCDVVLMKHFLDRCMWTEEETVKILRTCSRIIPSDEGMIILGEAVMPSVDTTSEEVSEQDEMPLSLDALYMLVGRERQRTEMEWKSLAEKANLILDRIIKTPSPSCYILVLKKRDRK